MKPTVELIQEAILDASLSPIVENGIFDPFNPEHVFSLIESLEEKHVSNDIITEAVAALRYEGKFPDRQAFNKEGWLVTFPSAEYKQQAIKKHTHFDSDPTHGQGGMNLYYKRKGKQKRMTQQDTSVAEPKQLDDPSNAGVPSKTDDPNSVPPNSASSQKAPSAGAGDSNLPKSGSPTKNAATSTKPSEQPAPSPISGDVPSVPSGAITSPSSNKSVPVASTPSPASVTPPLLPFESISIEFAKSKGWTPTPYGEWRNTTGETIAVVGLCGEVVPIKTNDREELKLLADKRIPV
jgi:hypothetical protein